VIIGKVAVSAVLGFSQALSFGRNGRDTHTTPIYLGQVLEGVDSIRLQAQRVTFSFWAQLQSGYPGGALSVVGVASTTSGADDTATHLIAGSNNWSTGAASPAMTVAVVFGSVTIIAGSATAQKKYSPGASDTEIKIGNIVPYSGPASAYGVICKTIAAYFNKVNAEGGINRRKIRFTSCEGEADSAVGEEFVRGPALLICWTTNLETVTSRERAAPGVAAASSVGEGALAGAKQIGDTMPITEARTEYGTSQECFSTGVQALATDIRPHIACRRSGRGWLRELDPDGKTLGSVTVTHLEPSWRNRRQIRTDACRTLSGYWDTKS
jgi:hypothetical protein